MRSIAEVDADDRLERHALVDQPRRKFQDAKQGGVLCLTGSFSRLLLSLRGRRPLLRPERARSLRSNRSSRGPFPVWHERCSSS